MSSSFWKADDHAAATPVSAISNFVTMTAPRGGFRSRFGAVGDGAGWTATRAGVADHMAAEPEVDPIEEASQQGFLIGFQEGERVTREAFEADDSLRREIAAAIGQLGGVEEGTLASLLSTAVLRLVTQIMGEVPVDEARLAERCAAVAAHIDPDDGKAVLEVSPLDLPLIPTDGIGVTLVPNAQLSRGSVRLATSDGWIEDGPDIRLSRLKAMMDDMEGRL
jgi:flagellar assembly protein FliH